MCPKLIYVTVALNSAEISPRR